MPDSSSNGSLSEKIQQWNAEHASEFPEEVQRIFAAKAQEIIGSKLPAAVLALSPQVKERREDVVMVGFEDLCDQGNEVARSYGLVYPLGEEIAKIYQGFGIHLDQLNGDDSLELPLPATYIVDREARIRYAFTSGDISERAEPDELVEMLAEL